MENPNRSAHITSAKKITITGMQGWELSCNECNFHLRYFPSENSQGAHLEIFSLGDLYAQHLNDIVCLEVKQLEHCDEEWLTPEIRQTLEQILKKFDDE